MFIRTQHIYPERSDIQMMTYFRKNLGHNNVNKAIKA